MRSLVRLFPWLLLAGICAAQDTNFQVGPQYLITTGSTMMFHPIATPSLSLEPALPPAPTESTSEVAATPTSEAGPSNTFLGDVYWGEHADNEIVGRRLVTPSMTPSETAAYMDKVANLVANGATTPAAELPEATSVIEISSTQLQANLPPTLFDPGVTATSNAQTLLDRGYGIPLGEVAAYWKAHKGRAPHTYTNDDVERLHNR